MTRTDERVCLHVSYHEIEVSFAIQENESIRCLDFLDLKDSSHILLSRILKWVVSMRQNKHISADFFT
jgi:hypothetical protein